MSKDQVWKINIFFYTNRPKKIFSNLSSLEIDKNFSILQDWVGTLEKSYTLHLFLIGKFWILGFFG